MHPGQNFKRVEAMENDLSVSVLSRPESLAELIDNISPTIYDSLKSAIELGKWPDGSRLSSDQVDKCMQAVILYEAEHLPQQRRTGFGLPERCAKQQKK